ncbi:hypothetical protein AB0O87_13985 [Microbacterium sp. NPDC076768]|uniref:hypothetical protein n=1 Tax=Microbacterium sp. NPDC076768 TaxID=3154858 RepID=UPI0034175AAB
MRKKLIALAGAGLLLTSCSTAEPAPTVTVYETVMATPDTPDAPDPQEVLALEAVATFDTFTLVVHAVDLDSAPEPAPQPDRPENKWASADVEFCATAGDTAVTSYWWRMDSADNRRWEPSSTGYSAFPAPAYAWGEQPVAGGTCHRGWITFVVGEDSALETVSYTNDKGDSAKWEIG